MGTAIRLLDVVALTEDLPQRGLRRGQVGTAVEELGPNVFEVEFCDNEGRTYANLALHARQLLRPALPKRQNTPKGVCVTGVDRGRRSRLFSRSLPPPNRACGSPAHGSPVGGSPQSGLTKQPQEAARRTSPGCKEGNSFLYLQRKGRQHAVFA